jgi:electron transport complex protein RnfD
MEKALIVSIGPHVKGGESTRKIMWSVVACLIPAGVAGVFIFGIKSLFLITAAVAAAMLTEFFINRIRKRELTIWDGSALMTGLLLAYNIPPDVPVWIPIAGACFAIAIGKQAFGGLGHNIFNPALVGRAFLMISWPVYMTTWKNPRWQLDTITSATPLGLLKEGKLDLLHTTNWDLLIGARGGCIGEVCTIALLIGAAYLLWKGYISWHIPVTYIATVALMSWIFNGQNGIFTGDVLFFVMSGGLILGAFFMATDYVTSPLSSGGRIVFGVGCGVLTFAIRKFAGYPEGVSYAILIMNAVVPLIDRYLLPKWFGYTKTAVK